MKVIRLCHMEDEDGSGSRSAAATRSTNQAGGRSILLAAFLQGLLLFSPLPRSYFPSHSLLLETFPSIPFFSFFSLHFHPQPIPSTSHSTSTLQPAACMQEQRA